MSIRILLSSTTGRLSRINRVPNLFVDTVGAEGSGLFCEHMNVASALAGMILAGTR